MSLVQNGNIASTPRCITLKILAAAGQFWLPHTRIPAGSKMTFTGMKAVPQSQPPRAGTISAFPLFHLLTPAFFFPSKHHLSLSPCQNIGSMVKKASSRMSQFYTTDFLLYTADFFIQRNTSKVRLVTKILGYNRHLMFCTALDTSMLTDIRIGHLSIVCSFPLKESFFSKDNISSQ